LTWNASHQTFAPYHSIVEQLGRKWVNWSFKQSIYYDKGFNIHSIRYLFYGYKCGVSNNIMIKQTSEKINVGKCKVMSKENTHTFEPVFNTSLCSVTKCTVCTLWSTPLFKLKSDKQDEPHSCVCVCVFVSLRETEMVGRGETQLRWGGKMLVFLCDNFYKINLLSLQVKGPTDDYECQTQRVSRSFLFWSKFVLFNLHTQKKIQIWYTPVYSYQIT
jgi:hypothetical protein